MVKMENHVVSIHKWFAPVARIETDGTFHESTNHIFEHPKYKSGPILIVFCAVCHALCVQICFDSPRSNRDAGGTRVPPASWLGLAGALAVGGSFSQFPNQNLIRISRNY